jgi:hypothetical protein
VTYHGSYCVSYSAMSICTIQAARMQMTALAAAISFFAMGKRQTVEADRCCSRYTSQKRYTATSHIVYDDDDDESSDRRLKGACTHTHTRARAVAAGRKGYQTTKCINSNKTRKIVSHTCLHVHIYNNYGLLAFHERGCHVFSSFWSHSYRVVIVARRDGAVIHYS